MNFGERLKALRKEKKMTQAELSKYFSLGESTISFYESNKRTPDYDTLKQIADFFDVSVDYLLGHSDKREKLASLSGDEIPEKLRDAGVGFIKLKEYIKKEGIPEEDVIKILEAIKQMKK